MPCHDFDNLECYSLTDLKIDFGVVCFIGLDKQNLLVNQKLKYAETTFWQGNVKNLIGFYLLGCPLSQTKEENNLIFVSTACLPIEKTEYDSSNPDFYDDPKHFYGRIKIPIKDIRGMSGGPLFSLEHTEDKHFRIRLIGIQRSWNERSKIIKVETMKNIQNKIYELKKTCTLDI